MIDREVLADLVVDLTAGIHQAITGLSAQELAWQPDAEGNSIGVTVWHISRGLDVLKVRFLEQPALAELWHTQGWVQKTGYDPRGIGTGGLGILTGYTLEEVAAIPQLTAENLLAYLDQAAEALRQYLLSLSEEALAQTKVAMGESLTAYQLIKGILLGCVGHLGEIEALKALHLRATESLAEGNWGGEASSQQKLEAVGRLFEAVVQRDEAALLEAYHPEVVIHDAPSLPYGGDYRGHEGAIHHVRGFYQTWDTLRRGELLEEAQQAHPPIILDTKGEYIVVLGQARVMAPSSERTVDLPEAFVFKVRDEKVIETWMFHQDTVAILDLLKQAEQQKL
jgi:ketosteroid isomerase-like protein